MLRRGSHESKPAEVQFRDQAVVNVLLKENEFAAAVSEWLQCILAVPASTVTPRKCFKTAIDRLMATAQPRRTS